VQKIASGSGGAAAVHGRTLSFYDAEGKRTGEHALPTAATGVARFGDEWLVLGEKQKQLAHLSSLPPATSTPFAAGKGVIDAFGVGRDDAVVVARGDALELWSRDGKRRWAAKGGPFTRAAVARDHVLALDEQGALVFFARDKGEALGALRLASTEAPSTWRLAHVDGGIVVLTLGEWLVWIDSSTRKTVRRVRARAKVVDISVDVDHVAVALEDGFVQAFRAATGEPRASFAAEGETAALALCPQALLTMDPSGADVRACERKTLDVAQAAASPVSAVAVRAGLAAVADRAGRVRLLEGTTLREVGAIAVGEATIGLAVTKERNVVAAGARVIMRIAHPWTTPRPIVLRAPPTAFIADESYAFAGTQSGQVEVYDLEAGRQVTTYALSSDDRITALARGAGATLIVGTGALDGRVLVVDVAEAKVVHRISPHEEAFGVTCLATDARGRIVASGGDDGTVVLLDPTKGRALARIRVNETPISMAFEPSGRRLACVFGDGTAAIVTFAQRGATVSDLGLRGATHVGWGDSIVFGFKDGHAESGDRHAPASDRPAARQ
jgi:outer membrane protein assembly factor BamB